MFCFVFAPGFLSLSCMIRGAKFERDLVCCYEHLDLRALCTEKCAIAEREQSL